MTDAKRKNIYVPTTLTRSCRQINSEQVNMFDLLLQLLQTDFDLPDALVSRQTEDWLKRMSGKVVLFYTIASTSLKTISVILKTLLAFLNWAY